MNVAIAIVMVLWLIALLAIARVEREDGRREGAEDTARAWREKWIERSKGGGA